MKTFQHFNQRSNFACPPTSTLGTAKSNATRLAVVFLLHPVILRVATE